MSNCCLNFAGNNARRRLYLAVLAAMVPQLGWSLPQDGQVTAGQADIAVLGETMDIDQHTQQVILEFDSFNVDAGETVNYHQPNADAVALNRVVGGNLAEIHGAINANGKVFLINPKGVLFGEQARVSVGGLMVSTLDMKDRDFLLGQYQLEGDSRAEIVNQGQLNGAGDVTLLGAKLVNEGQITAGRALNMHATQAALVSLTGTDIPLYVDDLAELGVVSNSGELSAQQLALTSHARQGLVENSGLIRANSVATAGTDILLAAAAGDVVVGGDLTAQRGDEGGQIHIEGNRYAQTGQIDVSAASSGGGVEIQAETMAVLHGGSRISADAGETGQGGRVILVAAGDTWLRGQAQISARGGQVSGDGGFVEVSGHQFIDIQGLVDVGANQGRSGLWYIDPTDITINNAGINNGSYSGTDPFVWDFGGSPPNTAQIHIDTIVNTLRSSGDVLINTNSTALGSGDITMTVGFNYDGFILGGAPLNTLSLVADRHINLLGGVNIVDSSPGVDGFNLQLVAAGDVTFASGASLRLGTGSLDINASGNISVGDLAGYDLSMVTPGTVTLPDAGFFFNNALNIVANDVVDLSATRNIVLASPSLSLTSALAGGNLTVVTAADNLSARNGGNSTLTVVEVDDLNIRDLGSVGGDIDIYTGANSDLVIANDIDLDGYAGVLQLVSDRDVLIQGNMADLTGVTDHNLDLQIIAKRNFSFNATGLIDAGSGAIQATATENTINLGQLLGTTVSLTAGNAIVDVNATLENVTASHLQVTTANGFGTSVDPIEGSIASLSFVNSVGDVYFTALGSVDLVSAQIDGSAAISALSGDLTLTEQNPAISAAVLLDASNGNLIFNDLGLTLTGPTTLLGQNITNSSGGNAVLNTSQLDLTLTATNTGAVDLSGDWDNLQVTVLGSQTLNLTAANDVQLNGINNNGAVNLNAGGNLTLAATGLQSSSNLNATALGNILLPSATVFAVSGDLALTATSLSDGDSSVSLGAEHLDLNLNPAAAQTVNTQVTSLNLVNAGNQTITVNEVDGLLLSGLVSAGDVALNSAADMELNATNYAVAGLTQLITATTARLLLPNAPVSFDGDLLVDTGHIQDNDNSWALVANQANLNLHNLTSNHTLNSEFGSLSLATSGGGQLAVVDVDGLTLQSLTSDGAASISTSNGDLTLTALPSVATDLVLTTQGSGDLLVPVGTLTAPGTLQLTADNISDGDATLALAADSLVLNLRSATDVLINSASNSLALNNLGNNQVALVDVDALSVSAISSGGDVQLTTTGADLTLTTATTTVTGQLQLNIQGSGDLVIPDLGFSNTGAMHIDADSVTDGDQNVRLGATALQLNWRVDSGPVTLNSQIDNLALIKNGTSAFSVIDVDALTLNSIQSSGNFGATSTAADLTLAGPLSVTGTLFTATLGSGDVLIPDLGLSHLGLWQVRADQLGDSDSQLNLQASQLDIQLRAATNDQVWNTVINHLTADIAGAGTLLVNNTGSLQLGGLQAGNDVSIVVTDGDIQWLVDAPTVNGLLSLTTVSSGDLILLDSGFNHGSDLAIAVDNVRDGDFQTQWQANHLDVTLRAPSQSHSLVTEINSLAVNYQGSSEFSLNNTGDLDLGVLAIAGAANFGSSSNIRFSQVNSGVLGGLALNAVNQLTLPTAGLQFGNSLQVAAKTLVAADDGPVTLQGEALALDLSGTLALELQTDITALTVSANGIGTLAINNSRDLQLTQFSGGSLSAVNLTVAGTLRVPDAGLTASGAWSLNAEDIVDSDRRIGITGSSAALVLTQTGGDHQLDVDVGQLDLRRQGAGDLSVLASRDLVLSDLNNDAMALSITDGNVSVRVSQGDLSVDGDITAVDVSADGDASGKIELVVNQGNLNLGVSQSVLLHSQRTVDAVSGGDYGIALRVSDVSNHTRQITLGQSFPVTLRAQGSDIVLAARDQDTPSSAIRTLEILALSQIEAYNNSSDAETGRVLINGVETAAETGMVIRQGRTLVIQADRDGADLRSILDDFEQNQDPDEVTDIPIDDSSSDVQYARVFGSCNELDPKDRQRCRIDTALKSFLSHWLVGGEMPPRTEVQ